MLITDGKEKNKILEINGSPENGPCDKGVKSETAKWNRRGIPEKGWIRISLQTIGMSDRNLIPVGDGFGLVLEEAEEHRKKGI